MPLTCENGICSTEVAAICLQPDRGNRYRARTSQTEIHGARSTRIEDTMTMVSTDAAGH